MIGAEVAGISSVASGSILAEFVLLSLLSIAAAGAAGCREAAWSCKAALTAAAAARRGGGYHRVARARRPRVCGGFGGAVRLADCVAVRPAEYEKS